MIKKSPTAKTHSIDNFFGKLYIVFFAVAMFACAAIKMAFTLSRPAATGVWKFILIFDTITTLSTAASIFLFYISSDTKSKVGTKVGAIAFLASALLNVFTQFCVLLYYMSISFSITTASLTILFFNTQSLFMLYFAIRLVIDVFTRKPSAKGALAYAGAKAFSIVPVFIIRFIYSELLDLSKFKTPFQENNDMVHTYPDLAFYFSIIGAIAMVLFALLYNKFVTESKTVQETDIN